MKLINLTSHTVVLYDDSGLIDSTHVLGTWSPSGPMARLPERTVAIPPVDTDQGVMPTVGVTYGEGTQGLPEPADGTSYVVSRVLAAALTREDVYFPHGEVRDQNGRIIGCRALGRFVGHPGA